MQFHISALDGTDDEALTRRMNVREDHFVHARSKYAAGEILMGGAILDEKGQMIGSTLFVEIENREALDTWLAADPYSKGNVWQTFTITEIKIADLT